MRRTVSFLLALLLATSSLLTGCGGKGVKPSAKPETPFTTEFELNDAAIKYYVANDEFETAVTGGPFYDGAQPLPGQKTPDYDAARAKKVAAIKSEAAAIEKSYEAAKPALAALRSEYTAYLNKIYKKDKKIEDAALASLNTVTLKATQGVLAQQQYLAMAQQETTQTYAAAARDTLAVDKAVELAGFALDDADTLMSFSALMVDALSTSPDAAVKAATAEYDKKMDGLVGDTSKALEPVMQHTANVDKAMRELASADYYFSLEGLGWMNAEMAKLGPVIDGLTPREGLTAEDITGIKDYYAAMAEMNAGLNAQAASVNTSELVSLPQAPWPDFGVEKAYAAGDYEPGQNFEAAGQVLATAGDAKPPAEGWLASGWGAVKSGFGKVKTGIGVGVDSIGLGVKNIASVGNGLYYGNSSRDIITSVMENTKEFADNYKKGVSGASTFKTAGEYIEGVEEGAGGATGGAAEGGLEAVFGKGKISGAAGWAVKGATKITVGMFTGLAKGIYKVANKTSSTEDVAIGLVEIGLSAVGGSKVLIKASQLPGLLKGGAEGVKAFTKTVGGLIGSAANAAEGKAISSKIAEALVKNGMTKAEAMNLVSNSIRLEINTAVGELIKNSRAAMIKKIRDLLASGGQGAMTNFSSTVKSSLEDLLSKGFKKTYQGYLDAGTTVIGTSVTDYVDNLVAAGLADGALTDLIAQAMSIPPDPEQVNGSWSGVIIITKIDIPESEEKKADAAGCEQAFKSAQGKRNGVRFKFNLGKSGSGSVSMSGKDIDGSGTATYRDGSLSMAISEEGTTYTFRGTVAFDKARVGGMVMRGTWSSPFQKSSIVMSGTFSATK